MLTILSLIVLAFIFLVVELFLLPGVTVAGLIAAGCGGTAIWLAFADFGIRTGFLVAAAVLLLSVLPMLLLLRTKTWKRFTLNQQVAAPVTEPVAGQVAPGSRGRALSRLSPMGTVDIEGRTYEARLLTGYADPQSEVEVVGSENAHLIVKLVKP